MERLDPDVRDVVGRGADVVTAVLDDLRPWLLERAGNADAQLKGDGTPVTEVDHVVNARLVDRIAEVFPDHAVVSEEQDTVYDGREWAWVIDPIDGTSNFTAGLPYWCVSIALTFRGEPVYALVDAPPLERRYRAVLGEGARRNGEPIRVRPATDWRDARSAHVPLLLTIGAVRRGTGRVRLNPRVLGAAALDVCLVADGTGAAAFSFKPKTWDHAAGALLIREAGGAYVSFSDPPAVPLRAGTDYAALAVPGAAGPSVEYLQELAEHLL